VVAAERALTICRIHLGGLGRHCLGSHRHGWLSSHRRGWISSHSRGRPDVRIRRAFGGSRRSPLPPISWASGCARPHRRTPARTAHGFRSRTSSIQSQRLSLAEAARCILDQSCYRLPEDWLAGQTNLGDRPPDGRVPTSLNETAGFKPAAPERRLVRVRPRRSPQTSASYHFETRHRPNHPGREAGLQGRGSTYGNANHMTTPPRTEERSRPGPRQLPGRSSSCQSLYATEDGANFRPNASATARFVTLPFSTLMPLARCPSLLQASM
jgi:hypothetical protein